MCAMKSKTKGKEGEREVANLFRKALGALTPIKRNHMQAAEGGCDLVGVPYFSVEVKRYKKPPGPKQMQEWWQQACAQAKGKEPLLVFREDFGTWRVMLWMQPHGLDVWMAGIVTWDDFAVYLIDRVQRGSD